MHSCSRTSGPPPSSPAVPLCSAASVNAATAAKALLCTRADFDAHLGSLAEIRNLWRFEALCKVRFRFTAFLLRGKRGVSGMCSRCTDSARRSPCPDTHDPVHAACSSVAPCLQVPLLTPLTSQQRLQLCTAFEALRAHAGQPVVTAGDPGEAACRLRCMHAVSPAVCCPAPLPAASKRAAHQSMTLSLILPQPLSPVHQHRRHILHY